MRAIIYAVALSCVAAGAARADDCRPLKTQPVEGNPFSLSASVPVGHITCVTKNGKIGSRPLTAAERALEKSGPTTAKVCRIPDDDPSKPCVDETIPRGVAKEGGK